METFTYIDIFSTKGVEYLFVLCYLVMLVLFWRMMKKCKVQQAEAEE